MKNLFKALSDFQEECPLIKKDRANEFAKFKFTDITDVVITIKPLLKKHGLIFFQPIEDNKLKTIIVHIESGEKIESSMELYSDITLAGMNKYQVIGSGISYLRKYQLTALLGIVSDEKSIDELKPESKKKKKLTLTEERFRNAVQSVMKGETKKETILEKFELTDSQLKDLELIEE